MYQSLKHKRENGAILSLMVLVMLLLSMTSLALIRVGTDARLRSVKSALEISARFAADAGIERALYLMNKELEAGTWTLDDVPIYTSQQLTASNANYTVTYTGDLASGYQITSVGQSGNRTKTVRVTVALTSPFAEDFAVFSKDSLSLGKNSMIDGFNSSDPSDSDVDVKIGTQNTANDSIELDNNTDIKGDIIIGPGGDPDAVVEMGKNVNINGEVFVLPTDFHLPSITPPDYVASLGSLSGKNITLTSSNSGKYSDIRIPNNGTLSVDGDLTLHVTGDVELENNADIEVNDDSTLTLYVDGDIEAANSGGFNNTSEIPASLVIYGTGTDQEINIKNAGDLYALIYAPNADMTVFNAMDAYGSFILKSFESKNKGEIYYDEALKNVSKDDQLARFTITHWEEF